MVTYQNNELEEDLGFLFEQIKTHNQHEVNKIEGHYNTRSKEKLKELCENPKSLFLNKYQN